MYDKLFVAQDWGSLRLGDDNHVQTPILVWNAHNARKLRWMDAAQEARSCLGTEYFRRVLVLLAIPDAGSVRQLVSHKRTNTASVVVIYVLSRTTLQLRA
jgi:hypothetical protein